MSQIQINNTINSVNVESTFNTVDVNNDISNVLVIPQQVTNVIEIATPGPQGPPGPISTGSLINTGSFVTTSSFNSFTSSYNTGSFTGSFIGTHTGSLFGTASYALTASFALNAGSTVDTGSFVTTSSFNSYTGSSTSQFAGTASFASTASYVTGSIFTGNNPALSASYALTASYLSGYVSPFPYTGSALITGSLGVTGSVNVTGGITGSLLGTASYAINAATASNVLGGTTNYIPLWNTSTSLSSSVLYQSASNIGIGTTSPAYKLEVVGTTKLSGSLGTISGSILTVVGSGSNQPIFTVQGSQGELFSVTDSLSGSLFSVNDISGLPILEVFSDNTTLVGNYQAPALVTTTKRLLTNSGSFTVYAVPTASYDGAFFEYTLRSGSNARAGQIMAMWSGSSVNYTEMTTTNFGTTSGVTFGVFISGSNMVLTGSASSSAWTIKTIVRSI
jgi:hypothetical protein